MPFKSKEQERYLQINEPEIYQDWVEKYGRFKAAESFSAELKRDSCCCGATKSKPCACMIQGVMECNATCPCSLEKGAESFGAENDETIYILKQMDEDKEKGYLVGNEHYIREALDESYYYTMDALYDDEEKHEKMLEAYETMSIEKICETLGIPLVFSRKGGFYFTSIQGDANIHVPDYVENRAESFSAEWSHPDEECWICNTYTDMEDEPGFLEILNKEHEAHKMSAKLETIMNGFGWEHLVAEIHWFDKRGEVRYDYFMNNWGSRESQAHELGSFLLDISQQYVADKYGGGPKEEKAFFHYPDGEIKVKENANTVVIEMPNFFDPTLTNHLILKQIESDELAAESFAAENRCSICSGTGHNSRTCPSHTMSICGKCGGSDFIQESYYDGQIYCQKCEVFIPTNELKTVKNPKWKEIFGAESFSSKLARYGDGKRVIHKKTQNKGVMKVTERKVMWGGIDMGIKTSYEVYYDKGTHYYTDNLTTLTRNFTPLDDEKNAESFNPHVVQKSRKATRFTPSSKLRTGAFRTKEEAQEYRKLLKNKGHGKFGQSLRVVKANKYDPFMETFGKNAKGEYFRDWQAESFSAESFAAEAIPIRHSRRLNGYYGIKGYEDASEDGFTYRIYRAPGTNDWFRAMVYDDNSLRDNFAKPTSRRLNPSGKMTISNDPASLLIGAFPKLEDAKRALVFRMIQDGNYHQMITDGNLKWLLKDYYAESFSAESYDSALVHLKSLMPINRDSYLRNFHPSELTHSSTNQINFNQASVNYSAEGSRAESFAANPQGRPYCEPCAERGFNYYGAGTCGDCGYIKCKRCLGDGENCKSCEEVKCENCGDMESSDWIFTTPHGEFCVDCRNAWIEDPDAHNAESFAATTGKRMYCPACQTNRTWMTGYKKREMDYKKGERPQDFRFYVCNTCEYAYDPKTSLEIKNWKIKYYGAESFRSYKVAPDLSSYTKAELVSSIAGPQGTAAYDEVVYDPVAQSRLSAESIDSFSPARLIVLGASIGVALGLYNTRRD